MRKLMITMQNDYDATNDITNPTMRIIYSHMKKGKTYTRKDIAKALQLPTPTVTARVSDLLMKQFITEAPTVWDEESKRFIGGFQRI
jgi:DNA-binding MarR family transcriptional regulator